MQKEKASLQASQQEAVKRAGDADCVTASAKEEIVIYQQQIARVQQVGLVAFTVMYCINLRHALWQRS